MNDKSIGMGISHLIGETHLFGVVFQYLSWGKNNRMSLNLPPGLSDILEVAFSHRGGFRFGYLFNRYLPGLTNSITFLSLKNCSCCRILACTLLFWGCLAFSKGSNVYISSNVNSVFLSLSTQIKTSNNQPLASISWEFLTKLVLFQRSRTSSLLLDKPF